MVLVKSKRSYSFLSSVWLWASFPAWMIALLLGVAVYLKHSTLLLLNAVEVGMVACTFHWLSLHFEAAHRLMTLHVYPPIAPIPSALKPAKKVQKKNSEDESLTADNCRLPDDAAA